MNKRILTSIVFIACICVFLSACATQLPVDGSNVPGFFSGLWHGFCILFALAGHIFDRSIRIYGFPNSGGWYDFGYVIGVFLMISFLPFVLASFPPFVLEALGLAGLAAGYALVLPIGFLMNLLSGKTEQPRTQYAVKGCSITDLDELERSQCIAIIKRGGVSDPESVESELLISSAIAIARVMAVRSRNRKIVGVGVIKSAHTPYASDIAHKSGAAFAPDTQELGYIAVMADCRGKGLAGRIVEALLAKNKGSLFAVSTDGRLNKILEKVGFVQKGAEWKEQSGMLSLWLRE